MSRLRPNRIIDQPATPAACAADRAQAQGEAPAIEQRGQATASAQTGTTRRSPGLPDHHDQTGTAT